MEHHLQTKVFQGSTNVFGLIQKLQQKTSDYAKDHHIIHCYFTIPCSKLQNIKSSLNDLKKFISHTACTRIDQYFDDKLFSNLKKNHWYKKTTHLMKNKEVVSKSHKQVKSEHNGFLLSYTNEKIEEELPGCAFATISYVRHILSFDNFNDDVSILLDHVEGCFVNDDDDDVYGTFAYKSEQVVTNLLEEMRENEELQRFFSDFEITLSNSKLIHFLERNHFATCRFIDHLPHFPLHYLSLFSNALENTLNQQYITEDLKGEDDGYYYNELIRRAPALIDCLSSLYQNIIPFPKDKNDELVINHCEIEVTVEQIVFSIEFSRACESTIANIKLFAINAFDEPDHVLEYTIVDLCSKEISDVFGEAELSNQLVSYKILYCE